MKPNSLAGLLRLSALLFFGLLSAHAAHAACSIYEGKVVFNEVYIPNSGTSFLELKVLDPSVLAATSNFQNWRIDLFAGNYATRQSTDVSSGFTNSATNSCGETSLWIRFPESVLSYLGTRSPPFNFVLYDTSGGGQIVDIMRLGDNVTSFYGSGTRYTTCPAIENQLPATGSADTQYDAQAYTGSSVKDWYRNPDGTGPWGGTGTSNTGNTNCGTNAGGGGTYGVAKLPSTTAVLPNTNFSYTLYSINGNTAVSSPASVVISDDLNAAGLVFVSCTTTRGTCTESGGVVTWTVGAVAANTNYTATLTVKSLTTGAKVNSITSNVGSVSATAATVNVINPLAEYRMEEGSWNGTSGEARDNLNVYNATAASLSATKPTTASASPAVAGDPGTCRYGVFNRNNKDYLALPASFPNLGAQSFTITAWIKTTNNALAGQRIFADDENNSGGYGFSLGDGGTGRLRFFSRGTPSALILDTSNVIASNTWYFVAAVADVSSQRKYIYVFNASGSLLSSVSATWTEASFGSDSGITSIGGETNASGENSSSFGFAGNIDEVRVYQAALNTAALDMVRQATHSCPGSSVTPARFNCIESGAAADTGHLYTKLAGTAFSFDVAALKSDGTVETGYVGSGNKNVTVELGYAADSACTGWASLTPAVSQTLTFASTDLGRKAAANMTVSTAYPNLRCRVTDANQSPSIVACSADNFAVRPTALTVTSTDAIADGTGSSATATPAIKAGGSFNLTATALAGYNGTPKVDLTKVTAKAGSNGALVDSFSAAPIATGVATSNATTYSEVGYFNFAANGVYDDTFTAVDQTADCTNDFSNTLVGGKYGCKFGNIAATSYFGRFIPDHFDTAVILSGGVPMACPAGAGFTCPSLYNGMVYSGQSFTTQVTAHNVAGAITANYSTSTSLSNDVAMSAWDALGSSTPQSAGVLANNSVLASAFSNGVATATPKYTFNTTPTAPTAIYLRAVEAAGDGVTSLRASSIEGGVEVVSGRIKLSNAYGSELLPLSLTASAQYYGNNGWATNTGDSATSLSLAATYNLVKNGVTTGTTAASPASGTLSGGKLTINLAKPAGGATGTATIGPTAPAYLPVQAGTATFGVYKGSNDFIYQREVY